MPLTSMVNSESSMMRTFLRAPLVKVFWMMAVNADVNLRQWMAQEFKR